MTLCTMLVARQQIPDTHQWTVKRCSLCSLYGCCVTTVKELLEEVFFVQSLLRCYKQNKSRIHLVVRHLQAGKDVNTEVVGFTALEAVTR
jgi:hypothetical protein